MRQIVVLTLLTAVATVLVVAGQAIGMVAVAIGVPSVAVWRERLVAARSPSSFSTSATSLPTAIKQISPDAAWLGGGCVCHCRHHERSQVVEDSRDKCSILDMQLDRPFAAVTPTVDGDVLAMLARARSDFTPPAVQRVIGRHSVDGVRRSLQRLASQGVVSARPIGRALAYSLNRQHLAAPAIEQLARLRDELLRRIAASVGGWAIEPELVALFGSAAVGPMRADSDIDVLVVRPNRVDDGDDAWRAQIAALESEVHSWTGNDCRVLEFSVDEARRSRKGERVLIDIARAGIELFGDIGLLTPPRRRTS